jgi:hypothetical protein
MGMMRRPDCTEDAAGCRGTRGARTAGWATIGTKGVCFGGFGTVRADASDDSPCPDGRRAIMPRFGCVLHCPAAVVSRSCDSFFGLSGQHSSAHRGSHAAARNSGITPISSWRDHEEEPRPLVGDRGGLNELTAGGTPAVAVAATSAAVALEPDKSIEGKRMLVTRGPCTRTSFRCSGRATDGCMCSTRTGTV